MVTRMSVYIPSDLVSIFGDSFFSNVGVLDLEPPFFFCKIKINNNETKGSVSILKQSEKIQISFDIPKYHIKSEGTK